MKNLPQYASAKRPLLWHACANRSNDRCRRKSGTDRELPGSLAEAACPVPTWPSWPSWPLDFLRSIEQLRPAFAFQDDPEPPAQKPTPVALGACHRLPLHTVTSSCPCAGLVCLSVKGTRLVSVRLRVLAAKHFYSRPTFRAICKAEHQLAASGFRHRRRIGLMHLARDISGCAVKAGARGMDVGITTIGPIDEGSHWVQQGLA